jgi:hypothetical protein
VLPPISDFWSNSGQIRRILYQISSYVGRSKERSFRTGFLGITKTEVKVGEFVGVTIYGHLALATRFFVPISSPPMVLSPGFRTKIITKTPRLPHTIPAAPAEEAPETAHHNFEYSLSAVYCLTCILTSIRIDNVINIRTGTSEILTLLSGNLSSLGCIQVAFHTANPHLSGFACGM